jgi:hypothetical protein
MCLRPNFQAKTQPDRVFSQCLSAPERYRRPPMELYCLNWRVDRARIALSLAEIGCVTITGPIYSHRDFESTFEAVG